MALRDNELARRETDEGRRTLLLRPDPLRARWVFDKLLAADGNTMRCTFTCSVRALPERTEQQALTEVLLGSKTGLTIDDVVAYFAPSLRSAASDAARDKGAEAWLARGGQEPMVQALREQASAVAFSCGLEILAPVHVELQSQSYEQHRLRELQRTLAEKEAAGQVEHLARAAETLKKFDALRLATPDLPVGRILEQFSPVDRGQVLQTLLLASANQAAPAALWAVAGPYLVKIDTTATPAPPRPALIPLPPTLGPLRSVQPATVGDERVLLVGARAGFMVVRPDTSQEPQLYADPAVESQLGFSRVVFQEFPNSVGAGVFIGCHGEAGIVRWALGRTDAPVTTVGPDRFTHGLPAAQSTAAASISFGSGSGVATTSRASGPRNLQVLDARRVIFSVASRLWILDGDDATELSPESNGDIIAIIPDGGRMLIVHEDGTVCTFDRATSQITCRERHGGRYRAAGALPWLGGVRVLLACEDGALDCVGADDPLITQFQSPYRALRAVAASADRVAAISPDRQRLILWNAWDGKQPTAEIYLTGLTRHRIADVEFA